MNTSYDLGIDLGTATVLVYVKGKGIVLKEPSVVAIDKPSGKILKVGAEALEMIGRTPGGIVAIRPLRDGVISDYQTTEKMLKYFISKVMAGKFFKPRVIICVPSGITEVEERAVIDAATSAGARSISIIEEPIAAAMGAGLDISKPHGLMVVDIGGGTTDVAVICLGGIVTSLSIKFAGDKLDEAIMRFIRKKYNISIGERTAEALKIEIGCVYPCEEKSFLGARGRNLLTGLPESVTLSSDELLEALKEPVSRILDAIHIVLERTPPELVGDISQNDIVLTGGGCLIKGLDKLIEEETGISVRIADDPISCVATGTGMALENASQLERPYSKK